MADRQVEAGSTAKLWNPPNDAFTAVGGPTAVYFGALSTAGRGDGADIDRVSFTETTGASAGVLIRRRFKRKAHAV